MTSAILVAGVCCLIALHAISGLLKDQSSLAALIHWEIGLSRDRSMGEIVTYGLSFLAATLFFLVHLAHQSPMYLVLSLLMAFIWFDDSAGHHERVGEYLAETHKLPGFAALRPEDTGEILAWGAAGLVFGVMIILSLRRRGPGDLGALALVSGCFAALVLFGIATDLAHVAADGKADMLFSLVEDGGEMLAIALIAAVALGLARNSDTYRAACTMRSPDAQPASLARPGGSGPRSSPVGGRKHDIARP